jgi:hypothetical protein
MWNHSANGYWESCGGDSGNLGVFSGLTVAQAQAKCCANTECAGFSFRVEDGSGVFKRDVMCGGGEISGYQGYAKSSQLPSQQGIDFVLDLTMVDFGVSTPVDVVDLFDGKALGRHVGTFAAGRVPSHGTTFVQVSVAF